MKELALILALMVGVSYGSYKAGFKVAESECTQRATLAAQVVTEAVMRASDALYAITQTVSTAEEFDDAKLKEIEDAARSDGSVCRISVDRLRALDAISN